MLRSFSSPKWYYVLKVWVFSCKVLIELLQGVITTYVAIELALLVLVAVGSFKVTSMFTAASALKLVSAFLMITLSTLDYSRSPRLPVLLTTCFALTLLLDATEARTLWLSSHGRSELTYSATFSAAIALKALILLLEAQQKSPWVCWDHKEHSPERTSGILSLGVFFWLNRMLRVGNSKIITIDDLYPLDSALNAQSLHDKFSKNMDYSKIRGTELGLVKVLWRTLKVPLLLPIPPRLAMLGSRYVNRFLRKNSWINYPSLSSPRMSDMGLLAPIC